VNSHAPFPGFRGAFGAAAGLSFFLSLLPVPGAALSPDQLAQLPPASNVRIDFARDIQPIFEASCVQCHARGKNKGDFSLETRDAFLEGEIATAGKSAESQVIEMIAGFDPDLIMPQKGKRLTAEQVGLFRAWIDQGMPWPKEINFFKHAPANLRSREFAQLAVPKSFENPLDGFIDGIFKTNKTEWPQVVNDRVYARRVWLDTIGLLPPPAELEAFVADRSPGKRARLVKRLLADSQPYAEHWLTFWNDMLRNDYKGTGYIDGGRKQVSSWLYSALIRNLPYDRFVAQLISPNAEAEGFTNGITWRGAVNASMVPPMQAAQGVAQVFLGVNLKCASCHDSFINEYTLKDSYGLASIYADGPLEMAECDKPTGHMSKVKFLYEELGSIDGTVGPAARKKQLADVITNRKNGRLPRTIVNRFWQRFMGYGLVEPVDEMDKPAWSPELMDWLAEDLVAHGYDLKHTMAQILTSRAYQLPSVNLGETTENFAFRGPAVRRLDAEQFSDALMTLVKMDYPKADLRFNRNAVLPGVDSAFLPLKPKWIWTMENAQFKAKPAIAFFKRTVTLAAVPTEAILTIAADNNYVVTINDKNAAASNKRNSSSAEVFNLAPFLVAGENVISVKATNLQADLSAVPTTPAELASATDSPAGVLFYARIRAGETVMDFVSDSSWTFTQGETATPAIELGDTALSPWQLGNSFLELAAARVDTLPVQRASLLAANPLMTALGRPNREQIVTVRQGTATTLQALELTNGSTLAALLKKGADHLLATTSPTTATIVESLYLQSLGRKPTSTERTLTQHLVGTPATSAGVQDLLWTLAMLPEFQLIN